MRTSPPAPVAAYDFAVPPLIRFGAGRVAEIGAVARLWGRRVWIVGGGRSLQGSGALPLIEESLSTAGLSAEQIATSSGEPTVDQVAAALAGLPRGDRADAVIVAVGGGSTIDLAKAVAALATNGAAATGSDRGRLDALVVDHLEGVGRGLTIEHWPLPLIAVPTTAGTGAEATRNAVISCPRRRFKKSMRSPMMVPRAAVVDPDLTASCDRSTVAASGLDCVTQLIESFICRFAQPLPRSLVLDALPRAIDSLPRLLATDSLPGSAERRTADRAAMSHAALISGMALANSGLGLAHGVAAALGVACGIPHGVACALMLPIAMRVNQAAARDDFALLERIIDPDAPPAPAEAAACFVARIERLCRDAGVPERLSEAGVGPGQIDWLAENSGGASMRGNPVQLGTAELRDLLASIA
jgi:alcohol dehydrogenase class IV